MKPDALPIDRVPYGSCDDPDVLDFSANVNPRRPGGVSRIYETAVSSARAYPRDDYCRYRVTAAEYVGCEPTQIIPTPGALAAIRLAIGITLEAGETALLPAPSFSEFEREVRLAGGEPVFVAHDEILDTDPEPHGLAVVCNPNNPTGETYDSSDLRSFADQCCQTATPLLIDEAFLGYTDRPSMAGVEGVIVVHSLMKLFGLPGIRAGFAAATGHHREALESARQPWNLSVPAADVGEYCMRQKTFVAETKERVRSERERLREELSEAFEVYPSDAPFLLVDVSPRSAGEVVCGLRERGILVRDATTYRGLDSHIRVAVRSSVENDRLIEAVQVMRETIW